MDDIPPPHLLLQDVKNLQRKKWGWALPDRLLRKAHGSLYLDPDDALAWIRALHHTKTG
jgi:ATP-dependent Lhr-like helicase